VNDANWSSWLVSEILVLIGFAIALWHLYMWLVSPSLNPDSRTYRIFLFYIRWRAWRLRESDDFTQLTERRVRYCAIVGLITGIAIAAVGVVKLMR